MNRCPDLVVCLKRDLQCLRPKASLVLIYRPNVAVMKGRVDLAQPVNRTPDLWWGSLYTTTRSYWKRMLFIVVLMKVNLFAVVLSEGDWKKSWQCDLLESLAWRTAGRQESRQTRRYVAVTVGVKRSVTTRP
ncbi:hypothetical protein TNCV_1916811 [Trichonephila clavipes]|uniref:Uncharacterized protein n=1 Tax=Trichonephila clavipes TaxID=2585209 RepID=A0A8X6W153_TRICX|nr:hypothetical protein TNCV_1916811 [Trichonephila clavipes]